MKRRTDMWCNTNLSNPPQIPQLLRVSGQLSQDAYVPIVSCNRVARMADGCMGPDGATCGDVRSNGPGGVAQPAATLGAVWMSSRAPAFFVTNRPEIGEGEGRGREQFAISFTSGVWHVATPPRLRWHVPYPAARGTCRSMPACHLDRLPAPARTRQALPRSA